MPKNRRQLRSINLGHQLISNQLGFSLVEELVALGLVSLGLVLLVAMITTGSIGVTTMGDKTTADSLARSQLELIKASTYKPDPTSDPYPSVSATAPYSLTTTIEYWDATNEVFVSAVRNDGMQQISVTVSRDGDDLLTLQDLKVAR
jgi:Tfp pilus assembly protein PilV